MPVFSAGATYVIGKVFIQHFASGGTLLDFNPPDYREFIKAQKEKWNARVGNDDYRCTARSCYRAECARARARRPRARDRYRPQPCAYVSGAGPAEPGQPWRGRHGVMGQSIAIILYVVFCVLAGLCGSQRRMGFFGTFLLSLVLTPVIVLLLLILTAPSRAERDRSPQSN